MQRTGKLFVNFHNQVKIVLFSVNSAGTEIEIQNVVESLHSYNG